MASVTIKLFTRFEVTVDGDKIVGGSLDTAKQITAADGEVYDQTRKISATTLTTLWNDDTSGDFDFLWIESDTDGEIQLLCNEGGDVAGSDMETGFVIPIKAGVPFVLGGDDSRNLGDVAGTMSEANYVTELNTWETTWAADTIDRIEWYHATGTAIVRIVAAT